MIDETVKPDIEEYDRIDRITARRYLAAILEYVNNNPEKEK